MIVTGIKKSDLAVDFMKAAEPEMTNGNTDGIGYSAINSQNELFMEKWHRNSKFLRTDNIVTIENLEGEIKPALAVLSKYTNVPEFDIDYMSYGNVTREDIKTLTMHTRFATCGKSMKNTHPFVDNEVSLIHNGIINNTKELNNNKISTCDSESALQLYIRDNLGVKTQVCRKDAYLSFLDELRGYWAFGILAKAKNGKYALDVIKGGAQLYFAYIPELGDESGIVFATNKQIIQSACKTMRFASPKIDDLKDNSLSRFDAMSGNLVEYIDFAVKKSSYNTYSSYSSTRDYDSFSKDFLKEEKLVVFDSKKSETDTPLADFELAFFDEMESELIDVLEEYDLFQGSNYSVFFTKLYENAKLQLKARWNAKTVKFKEVLRFIELYNDKKYSDAWKILTPVKTA